jgi:hypothetical protein
VRSNSWFAKPPEYDGGAFFALADSSIHFLNEDLDVRIYENLGTKNDGNLVQGY